MVHVLIGMGKHILWNLEVYPFPLKKAATQSTVPPPYYFQEIAQPPNI